MIRRLIAISAVVLLLAGLIVYSQFRPLANRVSGFVEADEVRVGSRLGGRVLVVHVEEGQQVTRGQVLVELEPFDLLEREKEAVAALAAFDADYRRRVAGQRPEEIAQAKARYDQSQAKLDLLQAGARKQEIEAARGRVGVAESTLRLAEQNYRRQSKLFEGGTVNREAYDAASEVLESARASLVVRKEELELLEIGAREEDIRQASAQVEEAKQAWQLAAKGYRQEDIDQAKATRDSAAAALDAIREQKKELTVTSPVDGIVEALDLQRGDLVPASGPMLSILDDRHLWVRAYVPENRVGLRPGQSLWITVDGVAGERFRGEVTFISPQAEFTPSNAQTPDERAKQVFRIKVDLKEGVQSLWPGMAADVWLDPIGESP
ncbi:MAG: efflux RND transporter periplasmic adaptor subunit [Pirellulales bacterium]